MPTSPTESTEQTTPATWRSPNEMLDAAKEYMLDGREPTNEEDWAQIMNFLALNIHSEVAEAACLLIKRIYDIPLSDDFIKEVVQFQTQQAAARGITPTTTETVGTLKGAPPTMPNMPNEPSDGYVRTKIVKTIYVDLHVEDLDRSMTEDSEEAYSTVTNIIELASSHIIGGDLVGMIDGDEYNMIYGHIDGWEDISCFVRYKGYEGESEQDLVYTGSK